jgi:hypothetical protein
MQSKVNLRVCVRNVKPNSAPDYTQFQGAQNIRDYVKEVSLALALSDFSASWRGSRGFQPEAISAGTVAICEFDQARTFEMRNSADIAVVLLRNEALETGLQRTNRASEGNS